MEPDNAYLEKAKEILANNLGYKTAEIYCESFVDKEKEKIRDVIWKLLSDMGGPYYATKQLSDLI